MAKYHILYELNHSDGTLIDTCLDNALQLKIGDGQLDPCLERCIKEAKIGRNETFLLTADEAFGGYDDSQIQTMDFADFNEDISINQSVLFDLPSGQEIVGHIQSIKDNQVVVDFNHLLAGQNIIFKVKVLEVSTL